MGVLKPLVAIAIVLCGLTTACSKKETGAGQKWPRTVEPRLSGVSEWAPCHTKLTSGHMVPEAVCQAVTLAPVECSDVMINSREGAAETIALHPECIDEAIDALEHRFAPRDAAAMSDLAAAYYVRAQRQDRPSDFLRAYKAVTHALASAPNLPPALFNRALIEEALGLPASWDEVIKSDQSEWGREAQEHRDRIRHDDAKQWAAGLEKLEAALRMGDRPTVARLIAPFPYAAESYFEARIVKEANSPSPEAVLLAEEIVRLTHDPFAIDVAKALRAHKTLNDSPYGLLNRIVQAKDLANTNTAEAFRGAAAMLGPVEREARTRGYVHIALRAQVTRAFCLLYQGLFMDALEQYDDAAGEYERRHENDLLTDTRMRRISAYRAFGLHEAAWQEAFAVLQNFSHLTAERSRQAAFGEIAQAALAAGGDAAALRYADAGVAFSEGPGAYRTRAQIEASLGLTTRAASDLDHAISLTKKSDPNSRRILQARNDAVRGELLLRGNRARAIEAFTAALQATSRELPTILVSLYAQRAEARFAIGQNDEAERDLKEALRILREEESHALEARTLGKGEDYWSAYFSRFQDAFRLLIRHLVDNGRFDDAFKYAEQARAFEPLNLVMRPDEIDRITLKEIQADLPAGTFILEYSVLDDRTIVWIISRDRFETLRLDVPRSKVEGWSTTLRRAAHLRDVNGFEAALFAPFDGLFTRPLAKIGPAADRLVIVPDGPMHALPFAALRNRRGYLVENYKISTAGSAKLYRFLLRRDRQLASIANARVLLIGDPTVNPASPFMRGLRPLRHARAEVEEIASMYAGSEVLRGDAATVPRFLARAPGSAVIHIAAHGIANSAQPSHSLIVLTPSEHDSGALDAQRLITSLTLQQTKLVVLSACSSAGGLPIGPEGVAPLVRPLIAAGVPAVVGSLWDVNDATAEALLVSFHRRYKQGDDAAAAMQAAQLEMLRNTNNPGLRPALVWAPFQVIGHSSSPFGSAH
jgi:CHAT domain-containing protein